MRRVYLIAWSQFDEKAFQAFLEHHDATWRRSDHATSNEELVEVAGRICYMSFGERQSRRNNVEYITHLIAMGHESVLEHASWSFVLTGVSRAFTHQLVRHRVGVAFSQLSQQYHDESEATFVRPTLIDGSPRARAAWDRALAAARAAYREIIQALDAGTATPAHGDETRELRRALRSAARGVLPSATETTIVMTANARALRHFLTVRGAIAGDEEMRLVAAEVLRLLQNEAPALFADFRIESLPDGSPIVRKDLSSSQNE